MPYRFTGINPHCFSTLVSSCLKATCLLGKNEAFIYHFASYTKKGLKKLKKKILPPPLIVLLLIIQSVSTSHSALTNVGGGVGDLNTESASQVVF